MMNPVRDSLRLKSRALLGRLLASLRGFLLGGQLLRRRLRTGRCLLGLLA
jgi:hypothetical protein